MSDEKKDFDQLGREEIKEVRGGIPYEKPDLIELDGVKKECNTGDLCDTGGATSCIYGKTCSLGIWGEPTKHDFPGILIKS